MKKLSDMTDKELEAEAIKQEAKRIEIIATILEPAEKKIQRHCNLRDKAKDEIARRKKAQMEKSGRIDWDYMLYAGRTGFQAQYKIQSEFLEANELYRFGVCEETNQVMLSIIFYRDDDDSKVEKALKGFNKVLPHLKPRKDGYVYIHVIDKDCGEHEFWSLLVDLKKKEYVLKDGYSRFTEPIEFKTLKEALYYIKEALS